MKAAVLGYSGRQLSPLGQRGGAVLLEGVTTTEVTVSIEVIVDRGVDGGEFLKGLYIPEFRHRPLSSSERLMRVLSPIVEPVPSVYSIRPADRGFLQELAVRVHIALTTDIGRETKDFCDRQNLWEGQV